MGKHIPLWALPPFLPLTFSGAPYPFLFIPVSSCREILFLDFPERLLITWSRETLTDFEKKPALNSLTLKFFKWYFVFLITGNSGIVLYFIPLLFLQKFCPFSGKAVLFTCL